MHYYSMLNIPILHLLFSHIFYVRLFVINFIADIFSRSHLLFTLYFYFRAILGAGLWLMAVWGRFYTFIYREILNGCYLFNFLYICSPYIYIYKNNCMQLDRLKECIYGCGVDWCNLTLNKDTWCMFSTLLSYIKWCISSQSVHKLCMYLQML